MKILEKNIAFYIIIKFLYTVVYIQYMQYLFLIYTLYTVHVYTV